MMLLTSAWGLAFTAETCCVPASNFTLQLRDVPADMSTISLLLLDGDTTQAATASLAITDAAISGHGLSPGTYAIITDTGETAERPPLSVDGARRSFRIERQNIRFAVRVSSTDGPIDGGARARLENLGWIFCGSYGRRVLDNETPGVRQRLVSRSSPRSIETGRRAAS